MTPPCFFATAKATPPNHIFHSCPPKLKVNKTNPAMASRIPHLLEPYLNLPEEAALVVLTGVLGASTNWLVLRHLHALLKQQPPSSTTSNSPRNGNENRDGGGGGGEVAVLLVSFLRDFTFWKENLSRLGIDLETAARRGRFGYVDGLSGLFTPLPPQPPLGQGQGPQQGRQGWRCVLTSAAAGDIGRMVLEGVEQLKRSSSTAGAPGTGETRERKVVVVIDGLDFVLAAASSPGPGAGQQEPTTAMAIKEMLMELREVCFPQLPCYSSHELGLI